MIIFYKATLTSQSHENSYIAQIYLLACRVIIITVSDSGHCCCGVCYGFMCGLSSSIYPLCLLVLYQLKRKKNNVRSTGMRTLKKPRQRRIFTLTKFGWNFENPPTSGINWLAGYRDSGAACFLQKATRILQGENSSCVCVCFCFLRGFWAGVLLFCVWQSV